MGGSWLGKYSQIRFLQDGQNSADDAASRGETCSVDPGLRAARCEEPMCH